MGEKYDLIVIGSGPAGHAAAMEAAAQNKKVAVIEKSPETFGGVCLNEGCIPAKSMFHSAETVYHAYISDVVPGIKQGDFDYNAILGKSRDVIDKLKKGLLFVFKKNTIDIIYGTGSFKDHKTISVKTGPGKIMDLHADSVLIAAGSEPKKIPGIEVDGEKIVESGDLMCLNDLPGSIAVVGAGAIGVEFASFFNLLGSAVTLIEAEKNILPLEDKEASRAMSAILRKNGVKIRTGSLIKDAKISGEKVEVTINDGTTNDKAGFDRVLIATGRVPVLSDLDLGAAGVKTDEDGFIEVNEQFQTSVDNIYAAGDVIRTPMLAHVASFEGKTAVKACLGKIKLSVDYKHMPNAVYSHIKVASIGLTEEFLKENKIEYMTGKQFFKANGRAVVTEEDQGFIKIIAQRDTKKILGVHIVGYNADEIIHEFVVAVKNGLTVEAISETVHAHPTFSECAVEAAKALL